MSKEGVGCGGEKWAAAVNTCMHVRIAGHVGAAGQDRWCVLRVRSDDQNGRMSFITLRVEY